MKIRLNEIRNAVCEYIFFYLFTIEHQVSIKFRKKKKNKQHYACWKATLAASMVSVRWVATFCSTNLWHLRRSNSSFDVFKTVFLFARFVVEISSFLPWAVCCGPLVFRTSLYNKCLFISNADVGIVRYSIRKKWLAFGLPTAISQATVWLFMFLKSVSKPFWATLLEILIVWLII